MREGVDRIRETALAHDVLPLLRIGWPPTCVCLRMSAPASWLMHMPLQPTISRLKRSCGRCLPRSASTDPVLVVKGSHLAYTHYARPELRSRTDTDLLIPRSARTMPTRAYRARSGTWRRARYRRFHRDADALREARRRSASCR